MTNTTITNFRQNIYEYVRQAVEFNDVINIATKDGNAVVLSEDEYNGMVETLRLISMPGMVESIHAAAKEPIEDCTAAKDLEW